MMTAIDVLYLSVVFACVGGSIVLAMMWIRHRNDNAAYEQMQKIWDVTDSCYNKYMDKLDHFEDQERAAARYIKALNDTNPELADLMNEMMEELDRRDDAFTELCSKIDETPIGD